MTTPDDSDDDIDESVDGGPPVGVAEQKIRELRYWVQPREDYLYVRYAGRVADLTTATLWLERLDDLLRRHELARILWESRPALGHPTEVRERIWAWLTAAEVVKVSAIVVASDMLRISANLSSVGGGPRLRAFGEPDAAAAWLRAQRLQSDGAGKEP